jgi:organic radical activating enzyme
MDKGLLSFIKANFKNVPPYALLYSQGLGGEYISYLLSNHFPFQPNGYSFLGKNRWSTLSIFKFVAQRDLGEEWLDSIINEEYFKHNDSIDGGKPFLLRDHLNYRSFDFLRQYIPNIKIISLQAISDEDQKYFSQLYIKKVDKDIDVTNIKNIDTWITRDASFLKSSSPKPVWSSDDLFQEYVKDEKIIYAPFLPNFYRLITSKGKTWKENKIYELMTLFARKIKLEHIKAHIKLPIKKEEEKLDWWLEKVNRGIDNLDPISERSFERIVNLYKDDNKFVGDPKINPFKTLAIDADCFREYNENKIKNVLRSIEEFTKNKVINEPLFLEGIKTWILKNDHLMGNKTLDYKKFKNFCVLPFKQLEIKHGGVFAPCCVFNEVSGNNKTAHMFKIHSLNDVWKSDYFNKLRADMMNNIHIKRCDACNITEELGGISRRIRETQIYDNLTLLGFEGINNEAFANDQPTELHLSLGDTCNQKCIICGPKNSTLIQKEWIDNGWSPESIDNINKHKNWQDNEENWKILQQWAKKLKRIEFFGGEPFLIEKAWNLLKYCVDNGYSKNIRVAFSTNNSIFKEEYYTEILSKFKKVSIMLSADGIEETFEYCRYPAKWKVFEENFNKVLNIIDQYENMNIRIGYTISVYSIGNLADSLTYYQTKLKHKNFKGVWLNMVNQPFLGIKIIEKDIKNEFIKMLQNTTIDKKLFIENDIDYVINYMNSEDKHLTKLWNQFFGYTCKRDQYRSSQDKNYKSFGTEIGSSSKFKKWWYNHKETWEEWDHDL